MLSATWTPTVSALGIALLVSSCAGGDPATDEPDPTTTNTAGARDSVITEEQGDVSEEQDDASETTGDRVFRPSQQLIPGENGGTEIRYLPGEDGAGEVVHHLHCEDFAALIEKALHNGGDQPSGWPQEWDGTGDMPDPYCHPDYLEVGEWERLDAFSACWEGTETTNLSDEGQPQAEIDRFLWQQSQVRAGWRPDPPDGTCAQQWAELGGGDPSDYTDSGNADDG